MTSSKFGDLSLVAMLLLYACIAAYLMPYWEFTSDDGLALFTTMSLDSGPILWGNLTSLGNRYPPFVYYIYRFFFSIHESIAAIQIGIIATSLLGHYYLVKIGREISRPHVGYLASLLLFFSPIFFTDFSQKFWEPAMLPTFISFALLNFLRYQSSSSRKHFLLAIASIVLALGCHLSSCLFFLILIFPLRKVTRKLMYSCLGIAVFTIVITAWLRKANLAVAVVTPIMDVMSVFSQYVPNRIRYGGEIWPIDLEYFSWGYLFLLPLFVIFFQYEKLKKKELAILVWSVFSLLGVVLTAVYFGGIPRQWLIAVVPGYWIFIVLSFSFLAEAMLNTMAARRVTALIFSILLVVNIYASFRFMQHIRDTGGIGWHHANLAVKQKVIEKVFLSVENPILFLGVNKTMPFWWYDFAGWKFLIEQKKKQLEADTGKSQVGKVIYIYQVDGLASEDDVRGKLDLASDAKLQIDSVWIYHVPKKSSEFGVPLY